MSESQHEPEDHEDGSDAPPPSAGAHGGSLGGGDLGGDAGGEPVAPNAGSRSRRDDEDPVDLDEEFHVPEPKSAGDDRGLIRASVSVSGEASPERCRFTRLSG
ncbi:MAG: hypothetical protein PGN07_11495 [Aeromicrobium erythreum]